MCIHTREATKTLANALKTTLGISTLIAVIGVGSWPNQYAVLVDTSYPGAVARAKRDLKAWHPNIRRFGKYVPTGSDSFWDGEVVDLGSVDEPSATGAASDSVEFDELTQEEHIDRLRAYGYIAPLPASQTGLIRSGKDLKAAVAKIVDATSPRVRISKALRDLADALDAEAQAA